MSNRITIQKRGGEDENHPNKVPLNFLDEWLFENPGDDDEKEFGFKLSSEDSARLSTTRFKGFEAELAQIQAYESLEAFERSFQTVRYFDEDVRQVGPRTRKRPDIDLSADFLF